MFDYRYRLVLSDLNLRYKSVGVVLHTQIPKPFVDLLTGFDNRVYCISGAEGVDIPDDWLFLCGVFSARKKEEIHIYNNRFLNGTVPINIVRKLFPNAQLLSRRAHAAIRLDDFIWECTGPEEYKVIILDDLGAISKLEGVGLTEAGVVAIFARVVKKDLAGVSDSELEKYMVASGFSQVALYDDIFPEFSMAVFEADPSKIESEERSKYAAIENGFVLRNSSDDLLKQADVTQKGGGSNLASLGDSKFVLDALLFERVDLAFREFEVCRRRFIAPIRVPEGKDSFTSTADDLAEVIEKLKLTSHGLSSLFQSTESALVDMGSFTTLASKYISDEDLSIACAAELAFRHRMFKSSINLWQFLISRLQQATPQFLYDRLIEVITTAGGFEKGSDEEEALLGIDDKYDILKKIHEVFEPELYLEIGVQTGKSFSLASCRSIGIDPMPIIKSEIKENCVLLAVSSDVFFRENAYHLLGQNVDLAFIDGMHFFEYALRDFINIERFSSKNTLVVMDDIYPCHVAQSHRVRRTQAWTGDVWKVVEIIEKYRPDLEVACLDVFPTGLFLVRNLNCLNTVLADNYSEIVNEFMSSEIDVDKYIGRRYSQSSEDWFKGL